jgi:uncharacterized RDD family membrane protein YckC
VTDAAAEDGATCAQCGARGPAGANFCGTCGSALAVTVEGPVVMPRNRVTTSRVTPSGPATRATTAAPASFGARVAAGAIDLFVLAVALALVTLVFGSIWGDAPAVDQSPRAATGAYLVIVLGLPAVYWLHGNVSGLTLGKRIMELRVVDEFGHEPGIARGLGRWAASWLSWSALGIGCLWVAWHPRRQAWHDLLAGTRVIRE